LDKRIIVDDAQLRRSISVFNRSELIFACSKLNLASGTFLSGHDLHRNQFSCLLAMRRDGLIDSRSFDILVDAMMSQLNPRLFAICRANIHELIRAAAAWGRDDVITRWLWMQPHVSRHFMLALLLAFKQYNKREMAPYLSATPESVDTKRRIAAPAMRSAITLSPPARDMLLYLGRGLSLIDREYFSRHPSYRNDFERHGLSFEEYISCVAGTMLVGIFLPFHRLASGEHLIECFEFGIKNLIENSPGSRELFERYYMLESQTMNDLAAVYGRMQDTAEYFDRKELRSKPIFRQSLDRMVVMDEVFLAERASIGPFFHSLTDDPQQNRQKFADFGKACERYVSELIERYRQESLPPTVQSSFVRPVYGFRNHPGEELIDGVLSDNAATIIFETKGVWLRDDQLHSGNIERFWQLITEQYSVGVDRQGRPVRHGVAQLFDYIDNMISGNWRADESSIVLSLTKPIIPVLVVHDTAMSQAPLMINSLALEFASLSNVAALPTCGCLEYRGYKVHSLIVLTVTELELLQSIRNKNPLSKFFMDYSRRNPERGQDLTEYVHVVHDSPSQFKPAFIEQAARQALNEVSRKMFGREIPLENLT